MKLVVALCLAAPAAGFGFGKKGAKAAPKAQKRSSSGAQYPSVALPWTTTPLDGSLVGDVGFDPLGFSTAFEPYFPLSYLREAEIKHGRVCMLAWLGYVLVDAGFRAPGAGALGDVNSYTAHDAAVTSGHMWFLLLACGVFEICSIPAIQETMAGKRIPGDFAYDPLKVMKDEKTAARWRLSEIKHCRLAMMAFSAVVTQEHIVHGHVGFPYF